ncbi:MAG: hypothetical protein ABI277_00375 [Burkholderiaceae bacterium]
MASSCVRHALVVSWALFALAPNTTRAAEPSFAVIAAADATGHRLSKETVALIFTRKQLFWEDRLRIQPVNLPSTHPLRRAFSQVILGSSPEGFEDYWREMYFQGVLPPHVVGSEEAVALFVESTPGGIGYVSTCIPARKVVVVYVSGSSLPVCLK